MYYFGYYSWNGLIMSHKWDGDMPSGSYVIIQKHKISGEEFRNLSLTYLGFKYPYKELP